MADVESAIADVKKYDKGADDALITAVFKGLGPAVHNRDASLVSCSDQAELDRVRDNFLVKKLGMTKGPELDAAIKETALLKVGLTGGIGCGKSTAVNAFRAFGVSIIDADKIAKELVEPGQKALKEIKKQFGSEVVLNNGELNRPFLKERVFSDSASLEKLESILHPRVKKEIERQFSELTSSLEGNSYVIADVPLLVEKGYEKMFDRVIVVDCYPEQQLSRVKARDNLEIEVIKNIIKTQAGREERLGFATDVLDNTKNKDKLHLIHNRPEYRSNRNKKGVMAVYEQPLNEKIRLFMRLGYLLNRFNYHLKDPSPENSQAAILVLLELYNLSSRLDVKNATLNVLEWQSQAVRRVENMDGVDAEEFQRILRRLEEKSKRLYNFHGQLGQHLKSHNFFNILKQRSSIAGGINGVDVPLFKYWLSRSEKDRTDDLKSWVKSYEVAHEAIQLVMELIMTSSEQETILAEGGFYQATLSAGKEYQLLQIELPQGATYYPEISAGKQRFSVRFVDSSVLEEKGKQILNDVEFKLRLCKL
ncbi:Dephospho-CoA kinase [Nymphon striatum]|nr:Dephospho-CoA kinase [Nymphon striatum]